MKKCTVQRERDTQTRQEEEEEEEEEEEREREKEGKKDEKQRVVTSCVSVCMVVLVGSTVWPAVAHTHDGGGNACDARTQTTLYMCVAPYTEEEEEENNNQ